VRAASANRMHSAALLRNWSKLGKSAFISIDVGTERAPRQRFVISRSLSFKWNPKRTKRSVRLGAGRFPRVPSARTSLCAPLSRRRWMSGRSSKKVLARACGEGWPYPHRGVCGPAPANWCGRGEALSKCTMRSRRMRRLGNVGADRSSGGTWRDNR
jgi:hypothetical protein